MLSVKAPDEKPLSIIATADIETDKEGHLLDVNFAYKDPSGVLCYATYACWDDWLIHVARACTRYRIPYVYFHNGGGFDYVELTKKLLKGELDHIASYESCMLSGGSIMQLTVDVKGFKRPVKLRDSFRLLPHSLEHLSGPKGFNLKLPKLEVPEKYKSDMGAYRDKYPDKYHAYHKRDTLALLEMLEIFRDGINEVSPVGDLSLSIGSTALKVFRTSFLDQDIATPGQDELDFTYRAFQGGRTEYVGDGGPDPGCRATYSGVHQWDSNSHYPAVMRDLLFPTVRGVAVHAGHAPRRRDGRLKHGVYLARYRQRHGRIAIIKPLDERGRPMKDAQWEGETIATHIEFNEIEANGGEVSIIEGFFYPDRCLKPIFRKFIDTLYSLRLDYKAKGNTVMVNIVKLLMNNLFGKFGERQERDTLAVMTPSEAEKAIRESLSVTPLPLLGDDVYAVTNKKLVQHAFPAISAMITAEGRVRLLRLANDRGIRIIYMDTDSVHTRDSFPDDLKSETDLGMFKCETSDYPEGITEVIGGRKLYINVTQAKAKVKGVPGKAVIALQLANSIETGKPMRFDYQSPSKIRTAIKLDVSANLFRDLHRTVEAEQSSFQKGLLR